MNSFTFLPKKQKYFRKLDVLKRYGTEYVIMSYLILLGKFVKNYYIILTCLTLFCSTIFRLPLEIINVKIKKEEEKLRLLKK